MNGRKIMQKAEMQRPSVHHAEIGRNMGSALASHQGGKVSQFQSMIDSSPVMAAQRGKIETVVQRVMEDPMQGKFWAGAPRSGNVIQLGGSKWTEHRGRELIKKRWESGGFACFLTRDGESFYVEAWRGEKDNLEYAGAVQIDPKGEELIMHTRSEMGMEGGLGMVMMNEAVKIVAEKLSGFKFVQMTPAPGAASKKVIEILSATVGNPEIHSEAMEMQQIRKNWEKENKGLEERKETKEERDNRLQTWSPMLLKEHSLHLESLVSSKNTKGIQISGPAGGLIGFPKEATSEPSKHVETISQNKNASGYGIYIPMEKFLEMAKGFK